MLRTHSRVGSKSRLLVAVTVFALASLSFVGVASATGETPGACIAEELEHGGLAILEGEDEEAKKEFDKDLEHCFQAPNPILPETTEIIWGGLAFLVLLGALWKWAIPAMQAGLATRSDKIRQDLVAAESARLEAEGLQAEYETKLAEARTESGRIVDEARQTADAMKTELQAKAETDIAEMRSRAAADVEASMTQAVADLQGEVASLAVGAAEQVVEKNLDAAAQMELIENYINQVRS